MATLHMEISYLVTSVMCKRLLALVSRKSSPIRILRFTFGPKRSFRRPSMTPHQPCTKLALDWCPSTTRSFIVHTTRNGWQKANQVVKSIIQSVSTTYYSGMIHRWIQGVPIIWVKHQRSNNSFSKGWRSQYILRLSAVYLKKISVAMVTETE